MKKLIPKATKEETVKQEPKITIDYNDYEYKFYTENAPDRIPPQYQDNFYDIHRFLAAVDPHKEIKRKVSRMYRVKALDFISDPDKPKRAEFLVVVEDWYGKRADGTDVPPVSEHKNGVYHKLVKKQNGEVEVTNDLIYYIPFNKENVDEWINQSYLTDKDTIQYWVDTKSGARRKQFEYDEFVNNTWDELVEKIDAKPSANRTIDTLTALVQKQQEQIDQLIQNANKRK